MPVDPPEGRQPQFFIGFLRSGVVWSPDEFSRVIFGHSFRQHVVEGITDAANGGNCTDLGEALPIANESKLSEPTVRARVLSDTSTGVSGFPWATSASRSRPTRSRF